MKRFFRFLIKYLKRITEDRKWYEFVVFFIDFGMISIIVLLTYMIYLL